MKDHMKKIAGVALLAAVLGGCLDLDVVNPNQPDRERALGTAGDVESLIAGSFANWWDTSHDVLGGTAMLANMSFQFTGWPANWAKVEYSNFPRPALINLSTNTYYSEAVARVWQFNYRALSAVAEGLRALDEPAIAAELGEDAVRRARAWGYFVQGLAHGSLALYYQEAWVLDETTEVTDAAGLPVNQPLVGPAEMLNASIAAFDKAIQASQGQTFTIPAAWASRSVSAADLVRMSHSMKARYRAAVARTPAERAAVDWNAVIADVDAGITENFNMMLQHVGARASSPSGWHSYIVGQYSNNTVGWGQVTYMIKGMADQSGMYQDWLTDPPMTRYPQFEDGSPRLIITPDLRFPQGATEAEQRADVRTRRAMSGTAPGEIATQFGEMPYIVVGHLSWGQPVRGTWRWSYYRHGTTDYYRFNGLTASPVPEITVEEMRLLKAEALYRTNDRAGAADLINVTRVAAGLNATDADGLNTSCVPKLPDESCGDLLEMLKWEKRLETMFFGLHGNSWYFEGRGWGDLYNGTPLDRPVPCLESEITFQPCSTTGGIGGANAAPVSVYNWPGEA